jgi:hypothetical protein
VVWYNHLKLREIKQRVAKQHSGGGGGVLPTTAGAAGGAAARGKARGSSDDEERQPLVDVVVTHRWVVVSGSWISV